MKMIHPSVEEVCKESIQRHLEYCGRVCYNSIDGIQNGSDKVFLSSIIKRGHTSVLEHRGVCLGVDSSWAEENHLYDILVDGENLTNKFLWWSTIEDTLYISANIRAWKNFLDSIFSMNLLGANLTELKLFLYKPLHFIAPDIFNYKINALKKRYKNITSFESEEENKFFILDDNSIMSKCHTAQMFYEKYKIYTFKIICSRACQNQLVRHRLASFSVQSQRYCNYTKEKFNKCINFISSINSEDGRLKVKELCQKAEERYESLIFQGYKPEDAREVLPNATSTMMIMSAPYFEWERIFSLRCDPHAQKEIREICKKIQEMINNEKIK